MWKKSTLANIGEIVGGGTPSTKNTEYWDGDIPWLTPKDLSNHTGVYISRGERSITESGLKSSSARLIPKGSVLFSSRAPIGYVAIAENDVCTNQGFKSIVPNSETKSEYLYYWLKLNKTMIENMGSGTTFKEVSGAVMKNIKIDLPPLKTQRTIASTLSALDAKIAVNSKLNYNLEQTARAIYDSFFASGEYPIVPISKIIDIRDGTHDSPKPTETGYPLVTSKHLLPYGIDVLSPNRISQVDFDKINERSKVDTHDILISMIGTIGLISLIIEPTVTFAIKNVGLFKTSKTPDWLYYVLCFLQNAETANRINERLAGSTQKYISLGELRQLPLPAPPMEQLSKFNSLVRPIFDSIESLTEDSKKLAILRDTSLPKLMSGEISINDVPIEWRNDNEK